MRADAQGLNKGVRLDATHRVGQPPTSAHTMAGGLAFNHQLSQHSFLNKRQCTYIVIAMSERKPDASATAPRSRQPSPPLKLLAAVSTMDPPPPF